LFKGFDECTTIYTTVQQKAQKKAAPPCKDAAPKPKT
jgi:hypothetical protein